jgi:YVTN family beta-propeller protein
MSTHRSFTRTASLRDVVASPDGRYVFVSNIYANSVSAIDTESREVVAGFAVGKGPNGITFCAGT